MKYFLDTEFLEGFNKPLFGKRRHFIDLISIGLVCEDGREYYSISKDAPLKAIFEMEDIFVKEKVIRPLFEQYVKDDWDRWKYMPGYMGLDEKFTLSNVKKMFKRKGKTSTQIACELRDFLFEGYIEFDNKKVKWNKPEIYAYYADYDWVLFCSLFGRMIDLPMGMPMYCKDLKQTLDEKASAINQIDLTTHLFKPDKEAKGWQIMPDAQISKEIINIDDYSLDMKLEILKAQSDYPKQINEHSALDDARWNKNLYDFLNKK